MKVSQILYCIVFIIIIYGVGIVQGIVELRSGDTVQFLDVFEDTFISPVKRENTIAQKYAFILAKLEVITAALSRNGDQPVWGDMESAAEEALFAVEDVRKTTFHMNRHVTADSTEPSFIEIDTLHNRVRALYDAIQDRMELETIQPVFENAVRLAATLAGSHGKVGIIDAAKLAGVHFFNYTVFSRKYLRAYESEMEKTSIFANTLRPYMQMTRYLLFGDLGEKAIGGRKGWFYYKPDVEYLVRPYILDKRSFIVDPNAKPLTDDPVSAIVKFKSQLDSLGIDLLVVIIPGKPSVYPDMLTSAMGPSLSCTFSHSLRTMKELRDAGVETVDLFGPFAEERTHDAEYGDSIYLQKDTHWRARALRRAARVVAERIKQYPWYSEGTTEYMIDSVIVDRVGDVGVMSTLPNFKIRHLNLSFAAEPTKCYQVYKVERGEDGGEASRQLYRDDFSHSRILLLGDSFSRIYQTDEPRSAGWISHIALELSQPIASIVSDGGASTLVRQTLARKTSVLRGKRLVIWEFIERDLRFGAEGWKDVALDVGNWTR